MFYYIFWTLITIMFICPMFIGILGFLKTLRKLTDEIKELRLTLEKDFKTKWIRPQLW